MMCSKMVSYSNKSLLPAEAVNKILFDYFITIPESLNSLCLSILNFGDDTERTKWEQFKRDFKFNGNKLFESNDTVYWVTEDFQFEEYLKEVYGM